ncbi:hypothetical protein [Salipiger mucosus]|uniref:Uncharacterized protein n=1 Tax=Salipiger mucosus DSM 16094 TaxID=1123237 RepID=S9R478_9RHOB|nr:hypothetical protein [Salipiger mucosus]EPX86727.1 hypothetical protein Salmuc_01204 [Salipiger mucosus DSM 16094]
MRLLRVLLLSLAPALVAGAALAGAWPRPQGETFVSTAARFSWPQRIETWLSYRPTLAWYSLYAEHGLTDRWTLGLDLGRSERGTGKAFAFLRYPLRDRDRGPKISAQLGIGQKFGQPALQPGLSLGLGLENGWLAADGLAEIRTRSAMIDLKLDLTWGLKFDSGRMLILQMQTGAPALAEPFARLAPSMVFPLTDTFKAEVGGMYGLRGDEHMGVMFGLWAEF